MTTITEKDGSVITVFNSHDSFESLEDAQNRIKPGDQITTMINCCEGFPQEVLCGTVQSHSVETVAHDKVLKVNTVDVKCSANVDGGKLTFFVQPDVNGKWHCRPSW